MVAHLSSISTRMAVTRGSGEASLGTTRTLTVRRLISCWMARSMGFDVRKRRRCAFGREKTVRPGEPLQAELLHHRLGAAA